jgi:CRP-like cAMP-binding protein
MTIEDDIAFFERVPTLGLLGRDALRILAIGAEPLVVGRGALVGELALITETKRAATATALEPSTVLRIPRSLFLKMLEGFPDAAVKMRNLLEARSTQSTADIYDVRGRLGDQR